MGDIYKNDILNRFPAYTIEETSDESIITIAVKENSVLLCRRSSQDRDGDFLIIRTSLVGNQDVLPLQTPVQRDALTGMKVGQLILVLDGSTYTVEYYNGTSWVVF